MLSSIQVDYDYTNNVWKASRWLEGLPSLFAADFETASRYTLEEKKFLKYKLDNYDLPFERKRVLRQAVNSNGLSHPSLSVVTHLSVGWSDHDALVIVCDSDNVRNLVFNFLARTSNRQLWHNASFDFKHIYYHTKHIPHDYIDTQLLAKCILNNADSSRDIVKLKSLMAYAYGDWALSKDDFTLEEMWSESMIRYSAIDSCATYKLYKDIITDRGEYL